MKRLSTTIFVALLVCAAAADATTTAYAKVRSRVHTVGLDFVVAGTTVRAGTYRFSFDDKTNELTVIDRKTKEVVARAEARAEGRRGELNALGLQLVGDASPRTLAGIAFDRNEFVKVTASTAGRR